MPPKNPPKNTKAEQKKKQEALKDRTFGIIINKYQIYMYFLNRIKE